MHATTGVDSSAMRCVGYDGIRGVCSHGFSHRIRASRGRCQRSLVAPRPHPAHFLSATN